MMTFDHDTCMDGLVVWGKKAKRDIIIRAEAMKREEGARSPMKGKTCR
jgi:hypothetical protein